eukprot:3139557-Pleurochrysis_carterae.AAC.1
MLTGEKPRIMSILPFGCRAFAVKPRSAYSKTRMDSRAWLGINLGRSVRSPGAYNIWVPTSHRIDVASDVYFDERLFPWLPSSCPTASLDGHADADAEQPPGLPPPLHGASDPALPAPKHLNAAP